jgi:hypothetical protein
MRLSKILEKPHDFFCDLNSEFEKETGRLCCKKESLFGDYLIKFMFANMVFSLGLKFYFLPLKHLGQSIDRDYLHCRD